MTVIKNKRNNSQNSGDKARESAKKNLRADAENKLVSGAKDKPYNSEGLSADEINKLIHELKVHQIELEMQNEELRKAQNLLETSREKYFDLYDLAPVGYLTLDKYGIILEANLTASNMLEMPRSDLVNQSFSRFIYKEDQPIYFEHNSKLLTSNTLQSYELRITGKNGNTSWVLVDLNKLHSENTSQLCRVIISNIDEAKLAREKISMLLREKELILKEVHHRIKNNLNTVISILSLHANNSKNAQVIESLQDAKGRVNTMLVLYNKLYKSSDLHEASLQDYLTPLISDILGLYPGLSHIKLTTKFDNTKISVKLLPAVGIIINELLTNIAKYAFKDREEGKINISAEIKDKVIKIIVSDNGNGIPPEIDIKNSKGLGLQLVNLLIQQFNGRLDIQVNNGTSITLELET